MVSTSKCSVRLVLFRAARFIDAMHPSSCFQSYRGARTQSSFSGVCSFSEIVYAIGIVTKIGKVSLAGSFQSSNNNNNNNNNISHFTFLNNNQKHQKVRIIIGIVILLFLVVIVYMPRRSR
jgi:hypothetical protein